MYMYSTWQLFTSRSQTDGDYEQSDYYLNGPPSRPWITLQLLLLGKQNHTGNIIVIPDDEAVHGLVRVQFLALDDGGGALLVAPLRTVLLVDLLAFQRLLRNHRTICNDHCE